MTEEQKKAIDACKEQVAEKTCWRTWAKLREKTLGGTVYDAYYNRAMQLYGEQCRKEGRKEGYRPGHVDGYALGYNHAVGDIEDSKN